jgi:hypothetical protein
MPAAGMAAYGSVCGWTLARAHARSGDRVAIAACLGSSDRFDGAVADLAEAYAKLNEVDFTTLQRAARDGQVKVENRPVRTTTSERVSASVTCRAAALS